MEDIKSYQKEAIFNVSRISGDEPKTSENLDEIEANFVRRLKRGTRKQKDKLLLKCFNYGRIGHHASKCIHKEDYRKSNDDEKKSRYRRHDFKRRTDYRDKGKKSFCSMETHSFEEEDGEDLNEESLFLVIEEKNQKQVRKTGREDCIAC